MALYNQGAITVSVEDFGAVARPGFDNSRAMQRAIDHVEARGGGIVQIAGTYECGQLVISRAGVTLSGRNAWLVNARVSVRPEARNFRMSGLGIVDRRGDDETYLLDIAGQHCTFDDVSLVKDPIAGGYQMYIRDTAAFCAFDGLRLKGSNGIFISGHDHVFRNFELESTMAKTVGGDDAFAVKALGKQTYNIAIESGVVRGYSAILSIGSEVGTQRGFGARGAVRNVTVRNVTADRCARLAYIKPGGLIYDWQNGVVEDVLLENLRLDDPEGFLFISGITVSAGRGALVRRLVARGIQVRARAATQGVMPTAGLDLNIIPEGPPARIEDVDVQMAMVDPFDGAGNGPAAPGYPVDHIARVEKVNPRHGSMADIVLDLAGRGSRFGGIYVGAGLDDAVTVKRARLERVAVNPPSSLGGGGIWSDSRIALGDVEVEAIRNGRVGGKALP